MLIAVAAVADEPATIELATQIETSLSRVTDIEHLSHDIDRVNYSSCMPCHGATAEGKQSVFAPPLAGQERWYLERQLNNFQKGIRGNHSDDVYGGAMRAISLLLKDPEIRDQVLDQIEDYPETAPDTLENVRYNLQAGKERYTISCALCHGDRAQGNESQGAPRLNILPAWYTARQLRNFQQGIRGQHTGDTFGKEMRPMAMVIFKENELLDVAAYIASLYDHNDL